MNFAFNTVILFLIIFSGLACRRAYFSKEFSKNYIKKNTFDELVGGIFWGMLIQIFGIIFFTHAFNINFDFKTLGFLLIGAKDDANIVQSFLVVKGNLFKILLYNITIISFSVMLGASARLIVRKFKLDRRFKYCRFDNEWHYILSGEILQFPSYATKENRLKDARSIENKYINVLTQVDDYFVLYSGLLVEPFLSNDGGLDLLCLKGIKKKMIKRGDTPITTEHPMDVDIFVIPYNQILNLSVTYFMLRSKTEEENNVAQASNNTTES